MPALRDRGGFLIKELDKNLYKKFLSGKIDYWCFRADIGPKTIIFGLHVKFPKKNYFFWQIFMKKCSKNVFFRFLTISMRINNFIFFPGDDKLFY